MGAEAVDGPGLPRDLVELLDGRDLERGLGFTIQVLTADESGWPRVALLSAGEVFALDDRRLRLALWPGSETTANLTRTGQATLAFVHDHASYSLHLDAHRAADLGEPMVRAVFDGRVAAVRRDEVPYAALRSGITFDLVDPAPVLARWRATIDALRDAPDAAGACT
jgi:hypothetical protein